MRRRRRPRVRPGGLTSGAGPGPQAGANQQRPPGANGAAPPMASTVAPIDPDDLMDPDLEDRVVRVVPVQPEPRSVWPDRPVRAEAGPRDRGPLVPASLRTPVQTARFGLRHAGFVVGFQLVRTPKYAARIVGWAPRGATRTSVALIRWLRADEYRQAERGAEEWGYYTGNYWPHLDEANLRRHTARSRSWTAMFGVMAVAGAGYVALQDPAVMALGATGLVLASGWAGRPMDRPFIESAVVTVPGAKKITPDMVIQALKAAKLCKDVEGPNAPEFVAPGVYRDGPGYGAVIDLPPGYRAEQAIKRSTDIAAGLRVDEFRLFVHQERGSGGHAGQIRMWIADHDPHTRDPQPSPLVKVPSFDLWHKIPFGVDERGRQVEVPVVWTSWLIGALPRIGKSNALRLLLSAAALDPHCRIYAWDGKGGKDLAALEQVAHAFGAGEDDDVAQALVAALADLQKEMRARFKRLRKLPDEVCPDGKLTPALAKDPQLKMPLTVVAIDEFHAYLENKRYGKQIEELMTSLAKIGPAMGIILLLSTQRPSSKVMSTDLRDVIGTRFAMCVSSREFSEMILGSGSYAAGLDASKLLETHYGVGILRGTDDGELAGKGARTVHTHLTNLVEFRAVCDRGRALREGAGTLSGVAAGEEAAHLSDRLLEHVAKAFRGDDEAHSDVLCARMAEDYSGLYPLGPDGKPVWKPTDLAVALNRYGIKAGNQTWAVPSEGGPKRNRKGFKREHVIDAVARRAAAIPDSPPDFDADDPE